MHQNYNKIKNTLHKIQDRKIQGQGASISDIESILLELNTRLPDSYREFLSDFGFGGVGEINSILGFSPKDSSFDIIKNTKSERHPDFYGFPNEIIPFFNIGNGDYYCFNTFNWTDDECEIYLTNHEYLPTLESRNWNEQSLYFEKTHDNFIDWIEDMLGIKF